MYLKILTIWLCMSNADVFYNLREDNRSFGYEAEPLYNIHTWIKELHLQTCVLVAIGLKYFALFVENTNESNYTLKSTKIFLGICHQTILEQWDFCSKDLAIKRKRKCSFKLKDGVYEGRVHRRFCDFNIMVQNKDCSCTSFILEKESFKVIGFPTCYFSPLPHSLCKYNVCGLSKCRTFTIENLQSVECDPDCIEGGQFCEGPSFRSSSPPKIHSQWSKWSHLKTDVADNSESRPNESLDTPYRSKKHRLVATCINKYKNKPDLDCLGPGTGCCAPHFVNCTCRTYGENQSLKVEKIYYETIDRRSSSNIYEKRRSDRFLRDTEDDSDDDDDNEDLNEDIVLEEDTTENVVTTEILEKEELDEEIENDLKEELKAISKNNTETYTDKSFKSITMINTFVLLSFIINVIINIYKMAVLAKESNINNNL
ncbi:uncharacterized protein LOC130894499 [Diorhabda carinulata]|uniref:uncharacterized protein LOC130894132 n=1 Tax=Diorhabda carinulata TaxID=1163345 RepID=UPI0025A175AF|nr:uncharacterized protein LOC130894132 [Diorhabda carinulata]XP_057657364.1 uncharacterized protein LOC130894499 [Diorhabda carinulata]